MLWRQLAPLALVAHAGSCADPVPGLRPTEARALRAPVSSGTALERFFPLVDGHLYQYDVAQPDGRTRLLVTVERSDPMHGAWRMGSTTRYFRYAADGIVRLSDLGAPLGYVLKEPLTAGASFAGDHGGIVRISAVDAAVEVGAGRFAGCVTTLEERGGDRPATFTTTFCPDTGVVVLDAQGGDGGERAELQSFGPPVDLGPDGVRRIEGED